MTFSKKLIKENVYIYDKKQKIATIWVNLKNIKVNNTGTGKQL